MSDPRLIRHIVDDALKELNLLVPGSDNPPAGTAIDAAYNNETGEILLTWRPTGQTWSLYYNSTLLTSTTDNTYTHKPLVYGSPITYSIRHHGSKLSAPTSVTITPTVPKPTEVGSSSTSAGVAVYWEGEAPAHYIEWASGVALSSVYSTTDSDAYTYPRTESAWNSGIQTASDVWIHSTVTQSGVYFYRVRGVDPTNDSYSDWLYTGEAGTPSDTFVKTMVENIEGDIAAASGFAQKILDGSGYGAFISGDYLIAPNVLGISGYIDRKLLIGSGSTIALDGANRYIYATFDDSAVTPFDGGIMIDVSGLSLWKDSGRIFWAELNPNDGDVTLGRYDTTGGIKWDDSESKLYLRGALVQSPASGSTPAPITVYRGAYDSDTIYTVNDIVQYDEQTWLYSGVTDESGKVPGVDTDFWGVFAARGEDGAAGPAGADGKDGADGPIYSGQWDPDILYDLGNWVTYSGEAFLYINETPSSGNIPENSGVYWTLFAAAGTDGPPGPGIVYRGEHDINTLYFNNETRRDVVYYDAAYKLYNGTDGSSGVYSAGDWEDFGATFTSVATDLLLAQDVTITRTLVMGTDGGNDGVIRSADKDDYGVGSGFWLGNSGGVAKLDIGDSSNYLRWDGVDTLWINGYIAGATGYANISDAPTSVSGFNVEEYNQLISGYNTSIDAAADATNALGYIDTLSGVVSGLDATVSDISDAIDAASGRINDTEADITAMSGHFENITSGLSVDMVDALGLASGADSWISASGELAVSMSEYASGRADDAMDVASAAMLYASGASGHFETVTDALDSGLADAYGLASGAQDWIDTTGATISGVADSAYQNAIYASGLADTLDTNLFALSGEVDTIASDLSEVSNIANQADTAASNANTWINNNSGAIYSGIADASGAAEDAQEYAEDLSGAMNTMSGVLSDEIQEAFNLGEYASGWIIASGNDAYDTAYAASGLASGAQQAAEDASGYAQMIADGEGLGAFISGEYIISPYILGTSGYIKDTLLVGSGSPIILDGTNNRIQLSTISEDNYISLDESGIWMFSDGAAVFQARIDDGNVGDLMIGSGDGNHLYFDASAGDLQLITSGEFRVGDPDGNNLEFDATNGVLKVSGNITAHSGFIGFPESGWLITPSGIEAVDINSRIVAGKMIGSELIGSSGYIENQLLVGSGAPIVIDGENEMIYLTQPAGNPNTDGIVFNENGISLHHDGNTVMYASIDDGTQGDFFLGDDGVNGNYLIYDASEGLLLISGMINATSGYIGNSESGWLITASGLTGTEDATIAAGTIVGSEIYGSTITGGTIVGSEILGASGYIRDKLLVGQYGSIALDGNRNRIQITNRNIVINGGFESDLDNWGNTWGGYPDTYEKSNAVVHSNAWSYHHIESTDDGPGIMQAVSLQDGDTYTLSCWVYVVTGTAKLLLHGSTNFSTSSDTSTKTGEWEYLTVTHTIDAGGGGLTTGYPMLRGVCEAYFDDVRLVNNSMSTSETDAIVLDDDGIQMFSDGDKVFYASIHPDSVGNFFVGDPSGNNMMFDADAGYLLISGAISANSGLIGTAESGWIITETGISGWGSPEIWGGQITGTVLVGASGWIDDTLTLGNSDDIVLDGDNKRIQIKAGDDSYLVSGIVLDQYGFSAYHDSEEIFFVRISGDDAGDFFVGNSGVDGNYMFYDASSGNMIFNTSGKFQVGNDTDGKMLFDPETGKLLVSGSIEANSGFFGSANVGGDGWFITPTGISGVGEAEIWGGKITGTHIMGASGTFSGDLQVGTAETDGYLYFNSDDGTLVISGNITAESGVIGSPDLGWVITDSAISGHDESAIIAGVISGSHIVGASGTIGGAMYVGESNDITLDGTNNRVYILPDGCSDPTISGIIMDSYGIRMMNDSSAVFNASLSGAEAGDFFVGNVDNYLNFDASDGSLDIKGSVDVSGWITANSGYIGNTTDGWYIDEAGISGVSSESYIKAGNIYGSYISGADVEGGTVTGASVSGATVVGGTISGAYLTVDSGYVGDGTTGWNITNVGLIGSRGGIISTSDSGLRTTIDSPYGIRVIGSDEHERFSVMIGSKLSQYSQYPIGDWVYRSGSYCLLGDANMDGAVDYDDVRAILQDVADSYSGPFNSGAADITGNGSVSAFDASHLMGAIRAGLENGSTVDRSVTLQLADYMENIDSSDIVVNGEFDSIIGTEWTIEDTAVARTNTLAKSGAWSVASNDASVGSGIYQNVTCEIGKLYVAECFIYQTGAPEVGQSPGHLEVNMEITIGANTEEVNLTSRYTDTLNSWIRHQIYFTAATETVQIKVHGRTSFYVDCVSVRQTTVKSKTSIDQFGLQVISADTFVPYEIADTCEHMKGEIGFTNSDNFIDLSTTDNSGSIVDTFFTVSKLGEVSAENLSVDTIDTQVISNSDGSVVINDDAIISGTLLTTSTTTLAGNVVTSGTLGVSGAATFANLLTADSGIVTKYDRYTSDDDFNETLLNARFGTSLPNGFVATFSSSYHSFNGLVVRSNNTWYKIAGTSL